MKKKLQTLFIVAIATLLASNIAVAQTELTYKNGVFQSGKELKPKQVRELMTNNSDALSKYNTGRTLFITGQVIAYPCAFLFGFDLGGRLAGGGSDDYTLLIVGASGTVVGLVIAFIGESKIKNSVELYNANLNNNKTVSVNFGLTQNGVGLNVRF